MPPITRGPVRRTALLFVGLLVAALTLPGCGTATFDNTYTVVVDDPSHRLGPGNTVEVGIFDPIMGFSRDWAQRTMGTTAPMRPYIQSLPTTDTKMIFDSSPPREVVAALAVPAYNQKGAFHIRFEPGKSPQTELIAGFIPYSQDLPSGRKVVPLSLSITSVPAERGWNMHLTVHIPPELKD